MADGRREVALAQLARELRLAPAGAADLAFLADVDAADLDAVRRHVVAARYARHDHRFERIATLTRMLPAGLAARVAEAALGPLVAARTAGRMEPTEAARLAERLSPAFLADVTTHLDPARAGAIVAALPQPLLVEVGRLLLARGDHLTLGRFVGVMPAAASVRVVADAAPGDLLAIALHAEDAAGLDEVLAALPDTTLLATLAAAADDGGGAAVDLIGLVGRTSTVRLLDLLPDLPRPRQRALAAAVVRAHAWLHVLPALVHVEPVALRTLLSLPEIADPALLGELLGTPTARRP
ncbi:hypothetical protein RDV89_05440 [Nocardioides zeae]|uniref:Magnesium transporter MgtE intracellular domain-containing protein n=1 Tax=Nocardioides imazamoxiresistens TaxID=3231893 RepID=A0ABU3PUP9_9ACTN|nr:hypothetical protein [Nocardioides zeae]MDT9592500.1 hypothetical protein [Nocardioides zeae]